MIHNAAELLKTPAFNQLGSGSVVGQIETRPLDLVLIHPFKIASTNIAIAQNFAVRLELERCGKKYVGWGETPTLHPVTNETPASAQTQLLKGARLLQGHKFDCWASVSTLLKNEFTDDASVRAGLEMALIDAVAKSYRIPLHGYFGGAQTTVTTDVTIPICESDLAFELACHYREQGFKTLKTKVGLDAESDIKRLLAIKQAHPEAHLIIDANGGYSDRQALQTIKELKKFGVVPILFEQPVHRDDWEGLGKVTRESGVMVAADESVRSVTDAQRIAQHKLAHALNIKIVKQGVAEALQIVSVALQHGLKLMIGGMVESRLAMGFSAHFAAGLGLFEGFTDLDTPLLFSDDPIQEGYKAQGPHYDLAHIQAGHGAHLEFHFSK